MTAHSATRADPLGLGAQVRGDFPVLERELDGSPIVYLDSAATSLKPRIVIDTLADYYRRVSANIHRGKHMLSEEASDEYERVRGVVARFLGCQSRQVVFTPNTTHALNLVALGLGLTRADLVLCQLDSHHSNLLPWLRSATVELIEPTENAAPDLDEYARLLGKRPRVVALTHCSNVSGVVAPVEEMAGLAKDAGALVVVDAAQSAPHRSIRPRQLGADALAFSAHKMLGPTGIGVLYLSEELLECLDPPFLGGGTVDWVERDRYEVRKAPHRFEPGTPAVASAYGLGAAIAYLERLGMVTLAAHDAELARLLHAEAERRPYLATVGGTSDNRCGILSVHVPQLRELGPLARILSDSYGIMCRTGHLCAQPFVDHTANRQVLRLSTYVYTTREDVERAFEALDATCASLGVDIGATA